MENIKKIVALSSLAVLLFSMTGCTNEIVAETSTDKEEAYMDRIEYLEDELAKVESIEPIPAESVMAAEIEEEVTPEPVAVVEEAPEEQAISLPEDDFVLEARAEVVNQGEEFQVSSVIGTGVGDQSENNLYYPAYTQVSDSGEIFFVDGDVKNHKIRKINDGKITTVMDLVNNKLNNDGQFFATGLIHMGKNLLMVSNSSDIFYIEKDRMHRVPGDVPKYMNDHHLENIWRMKKQGDDLYVMFRLKGHANTYHIAEYDIETNTLKPIIEKSDYFHPFNFYVDENNIYVATQMGYIFREQLFPKQKTAYYHAKDAKVNVTDLWKTADGQLMFSLHDGSYAWVMKEEGERNFVTVVGSKRGYQDGVLDEVMMDNPMDFTYDGSGYIFADPGNHVIRKLWTTLAPEKDI